ncbi:MAG: ABC transporter permease [Solirubrobacteraceae bacterium]
MGPFDTNLVIAIVLTTTPILFAGIGELVAERAGVIDIGLEGMMLNGAFFGFWAAHASGNLLLGVVVGMLAGTVLGVVMAALSVSARADQIVVGIGITILATGATTFANEELFTSGGNQPTISPMSNLAIPGLDHIPVIGKALFDQVPLAYVAYLMVPVVWYVLFRTNLGLLIRGAGEYPDAVETSGTSVVAIRWGATLFASSMAGLGGVMLSVGNLGLFNEGMSGGRGYIALAAVIFGRWRPLGVLCASLIFGGADALQLRLQAFSSIPDQVWIALLLIPVLVLAYQLIQQRRLPTKVRPPGFGTAVFAFGVVLVIVSPHWSVPAEFWLMLPYVITLVVLGGVAGKVRLPAALGLPYRRAASGDA